MSENVYVVAPRLSESCRVQITSLPRAVNPESAIVIYTGIEPDGASNSLGRIDVTGFPVAALLLVRWDGAYEVRVANAHAATATTTFSTTATTVA